MARRRRERSEAAIEAALGRADRAPFFQFSDESKG